MSRRLDGLIDEMAAALTSRAQRGYDQILVPSQFVVLLPRETFSDTESYRAFLREQIERRLDAELKRLREVGQPVPWWRRALDQLLGRDPDALEFEMGRDDWIVTFAEDREGKLGDAPYAIYPSLYYADGEPLLSDSDRTRTTLGPAPALSGGGDTVLSTAAALSAGVPMARLLYDDDDGRHEVIIGSAYRDRYVKVGRLDGEDDWREVPIAVTKDVSRDHARIRYAPDPGRFEILDKSQYGTTLDDVPIPASRDPHGPDHWTPLPTKVRIGLAGAVTIDFEHLGARAAAAPDTP